MPRVCILGSGSYGTSLACSLAKQGCSVSLYFRKQKNAQHLNKTRKHPTRFSSYVIPDGVEATSELTKALAGVHLVVHTVPCQATPSFIQKNRSILPPCIPYVVACKGIYRHSETLLHHTLEIALGQRSDDIPLLFLSGPSFAEDIMKGAVPSLTLASRHPQALSDAHSILHGTYLSVETTDDVPGVLAGGAIKNVMAVAMGIEIGLGKSPSQLAWFFVRAFMEMMDIGTKLGGRVETLLGCSGIGDLVLTCYSTQSRNVRFGIMIGKGNNVGISLQSVGGEVVEGLETLEPVIMIAKKYGISTPICCSTWGRLRKSTRKSKM